MTGSEDSQNMPHSPRTKGIIQHFEKLVKGHVEGLDDDLQVTNEKIGQLEATQLATNTKLTGLETSVARIDKSLAAILRRFDEMHAKTTNGHDGDNKKDDCVEDNWDTDTEQDDQVLMIADGYVIIEEVWVLTDDARYIIMMMLSVR